MGRHGEDLTKEYILRFLEENLSKTRTHKRIILNVKHAFSVFLDPRLADRSITQRSIDKALSALVKSGVVKKSNEEVILFPTDPNGKSTTTRITNYEIDSIRVRDLIAEAQTKELKETLSSRHIKLNHEEEELLLEHLYRRSGLIVDANLELLKEMENSMSRPENLDKFEGVLLFESERSVREALKAFSVWKSSKKSEFLSYPFS